MAARTPSRLRFQAFTDGPDGPGEGVFQNEAFKVLPGALLPAPTFAEGAQAVAAARRPRRRNRRPRAASRG